MDTQSPDARALIWTGSIMGVILFVGLIAYYVLV